MFLCQKPVVPARRQPSGVLGGTYEDDRDQERKPHEQCEWMLCLCSLHWKLQNPWSNRKNHEAQNLKEVSGIRRERLSVFADLQSFRTNGGVGRFFSFFLKPGPHHVSHLNKFHDGVGTGTVYSTSASTNTHKDCVLSTPGSGMGTVVSSSSWNL